MKIVIQNAETGEIVERDMTEEEMSQAELDKTTAEAKRFAAFEAQAAKAALLEKLGITEEEAKLLLS